MGQMSKSVEITWRGYALESKSRLREVVWNCLATPNGRSVRVTVQYRAYRDNPRNFEARYSESKAPAWIPRPPDGWLDTVDLLEQDWRIHPGALPDFAG
jgi:hypothetical protein